MKPKSISSVNIKQLAIFSAVRSQPSSYKFKPADIGASQTRECFLAINIVVGPSLKPSDQYLGSIGPANLPFSSNRLCKVQLSTSKRSLTVQAAYSDEGSSNSAGIFVGGFVLGGIIVGTLGCVYAPQADRKDLMRKLPKFIYDEEKALEDTSKLYSKSWMNYDVSTQLRAEDEGPNGVAVNSDEIEANV
ncbi:hypothetical protein Patl1_09363 [Pistacia atlantica]|uniref:Uncharacterized protein n=1 Tax=Pistacia atlantica TaxID=434234 RepID=A0ACC1AH45_9ROSI|nr:hypothetical protein Patl1_09363 [Pistacia atlantica]